VGARVGPLVDTGVTGAEVEIGTTVGPLVGDGVTGETTGAEVGGGISLPHWSTVQVDTRDGNSQACVGSSKK
jgi:hypothetical protein